MIDSAEIKQDQQAIQLTALQREVEQLRQENTDLQIALSTTAEHGDLIEAQIHAVNIQLKAKSAEQQRTAAQLAKLLEILSQEKDDLETTLRTLVDHGDAVDEQWEAKLDEAISLASLDSLTQIANRRRFDEHLTQQWKQMAREKAPIAVILGDIDYFKQYNDLYGHLAGDACLKQIALTLRKSALRPIDLVARYGGEEFGVILPQTDLQGAVEVAERMRASIEKLQIPHARSQNSAVVTLSLGVACTVPLPSQLWIDHLEQADQQLYQAKEGGRNRFAAINSK
ncbi:diguanylate cyclase domain-containing protein [Acaryochloris thomasi]|uniref:diguanylate cyclase domain-containing protein n=1 Tax=Acaryochloris thomasi TaxID=2929456 RepID=UPI001F41439D|nr:diguanylate cyclase [Acaryochloris thomasi]